MYNSWIILIVLGFMFTIANSCLMISNYKTHIITKSKNKRKLIINSVTLFCSLLLIILGIIAIFIIHSQL